MAIERRIYVFSWTILVLGIFGLFFLLLDIKAKFIKFINKFWVKQAKFLQSDCTSLLLRSNPVQQNYLHIFKTFKTQCAF